MISITKVIQIKPIVIKELAHILTSPINQTIIVMIMTWLLSLKSESIRKNLKKICLFSLIWLYLCSQPFFSYLLMNPIESKFSFIKAEDPAWQSSDVIWVLACSHYNNERLPSVSRWNECALQRLVHAFMMYQVKPIKIALTGGDFSDEGDYSYAEKAETFLIQLGVKKSDILSIPQGTNTSEELNAITTVVTANKLAIVSSASHGLRISKLMKNNTQFTYIFIPVDHLNKVKPSYTLGLPKIASLNRSRRAIYAYFANIELLLMK
jgi:uncharacterized SAM-binding protein YcdF (DUF218 family)